MLKLRILIYVSTLLFLINLANAATIHGTVYDLSLKKVNNARVEINTYPKQFLVAQNSSYSFDVPNGFYTIKAQLMQKNTVLASVEENITIKEEGSYVLDLILFPDVEEGVEKINLDVNSTLFETSKTTNKFLAFFIVLAILLLLLAGAAYFIKNRMGKKKLKEQKNEQQKEATEESDLEQLIKIIKQEGNRITQKDIRKQIPLSEAKISLMIAELEHKGVIEKIKKGRGNIIILKNKK